MKLRILSVLLLPAILVACSTQGVREREEQALARHLEFAGAPVESFTYLGRLTGWRALGQDQLVVYTGVNDAYLLTLAAPCRDIQFASRIGVTSWGSTVSARFDSVRVDGNNCQITQIRPVDYAAVKRAAREERQATG